MYRTAAKRLLCGARYYYNGNVGLRFRPPQIFIPSSRFSTSETQPLPIPHATDRTIPVVVTTETENPNSSDSSASSSPSSSSTADDATKPRAKYEDQHTRVLQASLSYVVRSLFLFYYMLMIQFPKLQSTRLIFYLFFCMCKFYDCNNK